MENLVRGLVNMAGVTRPTGLAHLKEGEETPHLRAIPTRVTARAGNRARLSHTNVTFIRSAKHGPDEGCGIYRPFRWLPEPRKGVPRCVRFLMRFIQPYQVLGERINRFETVKKLTSA